MSLDDIDSLQRKSVVDEDVARRDRRIQRRRWRMCRPFVLRILARLGQGVGNIAVFGRGREGAYGGRIRGGGDVGEEGHVRDIVEVDLVLENNGEALAVQSYSQDGGREGEFADHRRSLRSRT